jgi:hypothetical protein
MKKLLFMLLLPLLLMMTEQVHAQSVTIGTMTTPCPDGSSSCWAPFSSTNPLSTQVQPLHVTSTNYSGSITTGGSWQQIAPANTFFFIQNYCSAQTQGISTTESLFQVDSKLMPTYNPTTAPGAVEIITCGTNSNFVFTDDMPIWVWAATTGHRFSAIGW